MDCPRSSQNIIDLSLSDFIIPSMKLDIETGTVSSKRMELSPLLMQEEFLETEICRQARIYSSDPPHISYRFSHQGFIFFLFFKGSTLRRMDLVMELFEGEEDKVQEEEEVQAEDKVEGEAVEFFRLSNHLPRNPDRIRGKVKEMAILKIK